MSLHVCSINEEIAREVADHLRAQVVAAARRLVLLRRLEWATTKGRGTEDDPVRVSCPWCGGDKDEGHADSCELAEEVAR